jgi:tetratricopeptide (TPR) repeat protein
MRLRRKRGALSARPVPTRWTITFKAWRWLNKGFTPDYLARAENYFERALSLDVGNVEALVGIALVNCNFAGGTHTADDRLARLAAAEAFATRALSLAPDHPRGRTSLGLTYIYSNRAAQGIAQCERALALDRNLAVAHGYIGMAKWFVGRGEESEGDVDEAFRLSPRDTLAYYWRALAGIAKIFLGRYEEALVRLHQSIEINANFSTAQFYLAVALAEVGRLDEARIAVQNGLALDPKFTILRYRNSAPSDNPTFMKARERNYVAMRKAGVPEE